MCTLTPVRIPYTPFHSLNSPLMVSVMIRFIVRYENISFAPFDLDVPDLE